MKKNIIFILNILLMAVTSYAVAGSDSSAEIIFNDSIITESEQTERIWEKQLINTIDKQTRIFDGNLSLLGYSYQGDIESTTDINNVLDELFVDTAYFAIPNLENADFKVYIVRELKEIGALQTDLDSLRNSVYKKLVPYVNTELKVVKLKWLYDNEIIHSTAIVTEQDGILFETLGYFVVSLEQTTELKNDRK